MFNDFNGFFRGALWRHNDGLPVVGEFQRNSPAAPPFGSKLFSRRRAGRSLLAQINDTGMINSFQPQFGTRHIAYATAIGASSTSVSAVGIAAPTAAGTATGVAYTPSTILGSFKRISYVTTAAAAQQAGIAGSRVSCRGSAAGCGGYYAKFRFSIDSVAAGMAIFAGLTPTSSTIGDVDPSSLNDTCGFAADAGDSNLQWIVNDNAGAATKVDLGANFPAKTNGAVYEATIFCKPNDTVLYYALQRLDTPFIIEGKSTSDLPRNTVVVAPQVHIGTRAIDTTVATIGFQCYLIESEL